MTRADLLENIKKKRSFLCIGLDTDVQKIPRHLHKTSDPIFEFNKQVIDATHDLCVAYKPNTAFYESMGAAGWESLERTAHYLRENFKNIFTIADAKRGDIGNTSEMYARSFFGLMDFDAVTLSPYLGKDAVSPFLEYDGKWVILLALTSNKGAEDFQLSPLVSPPKQREKISEKVFEKVLRISKGWGNENNTMYVVGATQSAQITDVRMIVPDHFLLVPGVGSQGGSLDKVAEHGMNESCGLLVNSSRGIIYAGSNENFVQAARREALKIQQKMEQMLAQKGLI